MKYIISEAARAADAELEPMNISEVFEFPQIAAQSAVPDRKEKVVIVNKSSITRSNNNKNIKLISHTKPR